MEITLPVLDAILYGDQSPWEKRKLTEEDYEKQFDRLDEVKTDFPFQYTFFFPNYSSQKTRYYDLLIRNQINLEVPRIVDLIKRERNPLMKALWLDEALNQCLRSRLVEIGEMIRYHGCLVKYLDPASKESQDCPEMAANCFVIRLLGRAYAKIYLEVQKYFADSLGRKMSPEDLYSLYIKEKNDPAPIQLISPPAEPTPAVNGKERNGRSKHQETPASLNSFTFFDYYLKDKLKDAWTSLVKSGLIAGETTKDDFERIFSGTVVETPVKWTGCTSDLYYFINLVHTKEKLIKDLNKNIWAVTCKCFVRDDGSPFDRHEFPKLHLPKIKKASIESAVHLLS
jgi:hypothetical protein